MNLYAVMFCGIFRQLEERPFSPAFARHLRSPSGPLRRPNGVQHCAINTQGVREGKVGDQRVYRPIEEILFRHFITVIFIAAMAVPHRRTCSGSWTPSSRLSTTSIGRMPSSPAIWSSGLNSWRVT